MARPEVGQIVDGYTFKGGNPNSKDSWEKAATGPAIGQVVDGYVFNGGDPNEKASWEMIKTETTTENPAAANQTATANADDNRPLTGSERASKYALQGVQFLGGMLPLGISAVTTTPVTETGIKLIEGKSFPEAMKSARTASLIDAGVTATGIGALPIVGGFMKGAAKGGIKSLIKSGVKEAESVMAKRAADAAFKKTVSMAGAKSASQVAAQPGNYTAISEILAGVPREATQRAVDKEMAGESIFKGAWKPKQTYEELGKKAQNAVNWIQNAASREVAQSKKLLKGTNIAVDTMPIIANAQKQIKDMTFDGVSKLTSSDVKKIDELLELLRPGTETIKETVPRVVEKSISPSDFITESTVFSPVRETVHETVERIVPKPVSLEKLQGIKEKAQSMADYSFGTVKETSEAGDRIIKGIAHGIREHIEQSAPDKIRIPLMEANERMARIASIKERLLKKLGDENVARNLKNFYTKDATTQSLFRELDALAPSQLKFIEELEDTLAREPFEMIMPAHGYTTGGTQGVGNIFRGGILTAGVLKRPDLLPMALAFSPKIHKAAIQTAAGIKRNLPTGLFKEGFYSIRDLVAEGNSR